MCCLSTHNSTHYAAACAAIDAANGADPTVVVVRGISTPLALAHGQLATEWISIMHGPHPANEWLLAARAHHLRRWEVTRSTYPQGKAGYLNWRKDQKARHAHDVAELLTAAGYQSDFVASVQALIQRQQLRSDAGQQAVEDAACLVFIETQLASFADQHERGKVIDIIQKTARKLSPLGASMIDRIVLAPSAAALLAEALAP